MPFQDPSSTTNGTPSRLRWLAVVLAALPFIALVGSLLLGELCSDLEIEIFSNGVNLSGLLFAAVGLLIVFYRPQNRIGWLCLVLGLSLVSPFVASSYARCGLEGDGVALPGAAAAAWYDYMLAPTLITVPLFILLPMLFPNGRFLSRRWRRAALLLVVVVAFAQLIIILSADLRQESLMGASYPVENPLALLPAAWTDAANEGLGLATVAGVFLAIASLVVRFRHSHGVERQQLKWLAYYAATILAAYLIFYELLQYYLTRLVPGFADSFWGELLAATYGLGVFLIFTGMPLAIGIALLRYRLYDIDIIIRKTLVYGVLTSMVILVYILVVGGTTTALQTQNNAFLSLLALALAAAVFIPARRSLNSLVDRYLPYTPPSADVQTVKAAVGAMEYTGEREGFPTERGPVLLSRILFALILTFSLFFVAFGITALQEAQGARFDVNLNDLLWLMCQVLANGIVALVIIRRYPRHAVGWLLLMVSFCTALMGFSEGSMVFIFLHWTQALSNPFFVFFGWMARWIWLPVAVIHILFIPQYFPDGRLLSRRWRIPAVAGAAGLLVGIVSFAIHPTPLEMPGILIPNPLDVGIDAAQADFLFESVTAPLFVVALLGGFISLILRYRRSGKVIRAQMKWVIYTLFLWLGVSTALNLLKTLVPETIEPIITAFDLENLIVQIANVVIPIVMGVAILRYRLFDIDLIIRRTLVYAVVTASLAAVYFGSVVLLQQLSAGVSGEQSPLIIVVSTLIIAALFSRLRSRAQAFIDRRFYRSKYDAARTLAQFAHTARDETDLEALTAELMRVVQETMQPESAGVWLRPRDQFERPSPVYRRGVAIEQ